MSNYALNIIWDSAHSFSRNPIITMLSITSILLWTSFLIQAVMASPGGERDHTPSLRHPEKPGKIIIEHALGRNLIFII